MRSSAVKFYNTRDVIHHKIARQLESCIRRFLPELGPRKAVECGKGGGEGIVSNLNKEKEGELGDGLLADGGGGSVGNSNDISSKRMLFGNR